MAAAKPRDCHGSFTERDGHESEALGPGAEAPEDGQGVCARETVEEGCWGKEEEGGEEGEEEGLITLSIGIERIYVWEREPMRISLYICIISLNARTIRLIEHKGVRMKTRQNMQKATRC